MRCSLADQTTITNAEYTNSLYWLPRELYPRSEAIQRWRRASWPRWSGPRHPRWAGDYEPAPYRTTNHPGLWGIGYLFPRTSDAATPKQPHPCIEISNTDTRHYTLYTLHSIFFINQCSHSRPTFKSHRHGDKGVLLWHIHQSWMKYLHLLYCVWRKHTVVRRCTNRVV